MAERNLSFASLFSDIPLRGFEEVNLQEYVSFIRKSNLLKRTGQVREGFFYTYFYFFRTDQVKMDKLRFYDRFPLILCLQVLPNGYFIGINFHHIPVFARNFILNRMNRSFPRQFNTNGYNKLNINIQSLLAFLKKSKIAVRKYKFDRVRELRSVENVIIKDLAQFSGRTYFRATITAINNRYRNYNPYR